MEKWAAVVRVSHMGRRKEGDERFHADADQVAEVERYAALHGATVEFLEPELSVSGGLPIDKRPSLKAAIEGVESGLYTGIITANLKRLTRSRSGIEIWERVEAAGGHVHCAAENLDTSTPNGRFVRDIHLADAVREREEHVDRFEQRRKYATAAGVWQRRQVPKGYAKDETRRLVPGPDADAVRKAFQDRAARRPLSDIARDLGMTNSGVRKLLENRVYLGELKVGQHVNPEAHPPLVTEDEWLAAQTPTAPRKRRKLRESFLLTGLVRCASCCHAMTPSRTKKQDAYSCYGRSSAGKCPAPSAVSRQRLDAYVEPIALAEFAKLRVSVEEDAGRIDELRASVRRAREELDAYVSAVSAADVGVDTFAQGAKLRREAVEAAEQELSDALSAVQSAPHADVLAVWGDLSLELQTRALSTLIEAVLVAPAGAGRVVPIQDRVRVIAYGAGIAPPYGGGGQAMGIRTVSLDDLDDEAVLGV